MKRSLADMAECLELLALGQADWLRRFSSGRDARPAEELERKKDQHELTKAAHITLKALAPFETDLRQWLREKMQERVSDQRRSA